MKKFERNQLALIDKKIRSNSAKPKVGKVTEVYEHGAPDDDSNWEVDVSIDGGTVKEQYVPVINPGTEQINIPKAGDKVMVYYTEEENPKPHAAETVWTNKDRPPVGKAGMWRQEYPSDTSPAGDGNVYVTGYTSYDQEAADTSKYDLTPEETFVQIAKHTEDVNVDPADKPELPFKVEVYDSPTAAKDAAHIHLDANAIDQDENLGIDVFLNLKTGKLHVRGNNNNDGDEYEFVIDVKSQTAKIIGDSNSGNKMGASFNFDTDEFKIADGNKFGIKSDGSGNFVWDHKSIDFNEVSGSTGSISL